MSRRSRYPRLVMAMKWVAILSTEEAEAAIRDYRSGSDLRRWGGGEAVQHYGGPEKVIRDAAEARHIVARMRALDKREQEAWDNERRARLLAWDRAVAAFRICYGGTFAPDVQSLDALRHVHMTYVVESTSWIGAWAPVRVTGPAGVATGS